jgi:hypothetical protein
MAEKRNVTIMVRTPGLSKASQDFIACHLVIQFYSLGNCNFIPRLVLKCICSSSKGIFVESNLSFKCLLLLDNAPGHPQSVGDQFPEVKEVFLPPNTTSLLQPMDQRVIATFKHYYTCHIMTQEIAATDNGIVLTLRELWKSYNIWNVINNTADS